MTPPDNTTSFPDIDLLNKNLHGTYGKMGNSSSVDIHYIQGTLCLQEFGNVKLLCDVEGSEKWGVAELFQREVDKDRVRREIEPFLYDEEAYKFFNPLTLTLLPIDDVGQVDSTLPHSLKEEGGFFALEEINQVVGTLKWDGNRSNLVCIDGQHRFTALSRMANSDTGKKLLSSWKIPVVVFLPVLISDDGVPPTWIDVSRSIFMNINSKSEQISTAREILLDNNDCCRIATQQLLDSFHSNDLKELGSRDKAMPPLYIFDWRGKEGSYGHNYIPGSLVKVEEIELWHKKFLLGEKGRDIAQALGIPVGDSLSGLFSQAGAPGAWSKSQVDKLRTLLDENLTAALVNIFSRLGPFKRLNDVYRVVEENSIAADPSIAEQAMRWIRYGESTNLPSSQEADVKKAKSEIIDSIAGKTQNILPYALRKDIGKRAVISAFSYGRRNIQKLKSDATKMSWLDFSTWFIDAVELSKDEAQNSEPKKWPLFTVPTGDAKNHSKEERDIHDILRHLSHDESEGVGTALFKPDAISKGYGLAIWLIVLWRAYLGNPSVFVDVKVLEHREIILSKIEDKILAGWKKELRPAIKTRMIREDESQKKIEDAVKKAAAKSAKAQIKRFEKYLDGLDG